MKYLEQSGILKWSRQQAARVAETVHPPRMTIEKAVQCGKPLPDLKIYIERGYFANGWSWRTGPSVGSFVKRKVSSRDFEEFKEPFGSISEFFQEVWLLRKPLVDKDQRRNVGLAVQSLLGTRFYSGNNIGPVPRKFWENQLRMMLPWVPKPTLELAKAKFGPLVSRAYEMLVMAGRLLNSDEVNDLVRLINVGGEFGLLQAAGICRSGKVDLDEENRLRLDSAISTYIKNHEFDKKPNAYGYSGKKDYELVVRSVLPMVHSELRAELGKVARDRLREAETENRMGFLASVQDQAKRRLHF